ncbi:translation initiation factor IF-2-like [Phacochoerus africanus]|uniref:translation initiation factor IF-2-like n=1 Tax=Phacochoerus africanus TaxID=41426 RepID=UPI001FD87FD3|nr:translation initiation factor IF-2-like [Phacochoerus africanus]
MLHPARFLLLLLLLLSRGRRPLLPSRRRRRPLQNPPGGSARRQRRASVAFPSPPPAPPPPASPELSVAQTSPSSPAGPARPSPHAPRTLSNPLGSRRLLPEETLAAAGAGAARLGAGRRRGARYGEPSNEARAGAQRRRVLAEHGRGAAAAVAAGAQGPLHHWQPWSPSIFLPPGRRLGSAHVLGEEGAGARASPKGGGTCAKRRRCEPLLVLFLRSRLVLTPLLPRPRQEGAAGSGSGDDSFLGGVGGQTGWCSDCSRRRSKEREQQHHEFQFPGVRRRHDMSQAFFFGAWRSPPPLRHTWARPRPSPPSPPRRMPQTGAAGSAEGRWLLRIGAPFCAVQLLLPCGPLALRRAGTSQPGRCCSCLQLNA